MAKQNATKSLEYQKDKHHYNYHSNNYSLRNIYKVLGIVLSAFCALSYVVLKTTLQSKTKNNKNSDRYFLKYPNIPKKDYFEKQILVDLPVT